MAQITKNQIIFDESDFTAGKVKNNAIKGMVNPSNQFLFNFDPFREYGIAQPGKLPVNATNNSILAGTIVSGALKDTSISYCVDDGGKFHEYDYLTNTLTNSGSFPQTLTGTSPVGQDVLIYKHNSGGTSVFSPFYSWYNNTNWNVGAFVNYTGTPDEDFMSTIPTTPLDIATASPADGRDVAQKSAPHPMEIGSDDILYIGSGRYLHAYDGSTGSNGTFSNRVLTLPQGFTITSLLKYGSKLLIAGVYSGVTGTVNSTNIGSAGESLVYVWNYIDLDITETIQLDDPYVYSIFSWRGRPTVITSGESEGFGTLTGTKVKIINGNTAIKIAELTGEVLDRGVDSSSRVLYINAGGKIYSIGDNIKDGFNVNQLMSCTNIGKSGWVKNIVGNIVLASSSDGATDSMSKLGSSNFADGRMVTTYYEVPAPNGMKSKVTSVQVEYYSTVTTAKVAVTINLSYDMNAGSPISSVVNNLVDVALPAQKKYTKDVSGNPFHAFSSLALDITWNNITGTTSTIKISRVVVNYELISIGA